MAVNETLKGATTARRTALSAADNVAEATFKAAVSAITCFGADELWLWGLFDTAATQTATVRVFFYDKDVFFF